MKTMEFRYLGVQPRTGRREYEFLVPVATGDPENVVLAIDDVYFTTRQLSFQEAPDLCYQKLRAEVLAEAAIPASIEITSADLDHYRQTHVRSGTGRAKRPKRAMNGLF